MTLAGSRAQRKTAGNRLSGLLQAEEEDDFYKTTYGGFNEESGDDEYKGEHSDSEDEVDSDFDIDEGDEPTSDHDDNEPKRKRRVVTKAYKEPIISLKPKPKVKKLDAPASSAPKLRQDKDKPPLQEPQDDAADSRKYMRQSTTEHTRQTFLRVQERQVQSKRKKGPHPDRPLTQEELLEEAKITEELNIRSLENYERLEADKKRQVHKKRKWDGPTIQYSSVTMPLITEVNVKEENVDVEGCVFRTVPVSSSPSTKRFQCHVRPGGNEFCRLDPDTQHSGDAPLAISASVGKCSRTFITFSDEATFKTFFPKSRPAKVPVKEICPVTHKLAQYRDPITDIPYSSIRSFKIIREAYKKYITAHGIPNAAMAAAMGTGPALADPSIRSSRQKIIIKQT